MRATLTNANPAATKTDHTAGTPTQAVGRALATVLGLLTIFGPISMDLYLPVLPALTIETLIVARFVQGLAGAVGIVIAQAAGRDLYSGPDWCGTTAS